MSRQTFKNDKKSKQTNEDTTTTTTTSLNPLPENINKHISWDELSPECEITEKSPNPRKRPLVREDEPDVPDIGGDFNDLFATLKADVTKSMSAKKKKYEGYARSSSENARRRIDEVFCRQDGDRNKLTQEFVAKIKKLNDEFQEEMKKMSETEEQLLNVFKHYHKMAQQTRTKSTNTFKSLLASSQEYKVKCSEMNKRHQKDKEELQAELEAEMQNLQKKIISYSKQEGIANFKKSLESMLTLEDNEL